MITKRNCLRLLFSLKKNIARFAEKFAKAISAVSSVANVIGGQHVL